MTLLQQALDELDNIVNSNWRKWEELASPEEFERWAKSRASHTALMIRTAIAQAEQPLSEQKIDEQIARIILDVAELPDRDSPEDWPEAMLVTAKELRAILEHNIKEQQP